MFKEVLKKQLKYLDMYYHMYLFSNRNKIFMGGSYKEDNNIQKHNSQILYEKK